MATSHWDRLPHDVEGRVLEGAGRLEHEEKFRGVLEQLQVFVRVRAASRGYKLVEKASGDCDHDPLNITMLRDAIRLVLTTSPGKCCRNMDCVTRSDEWLAMRARPWAEQWGRTIPYMNQCRAPADECISLIMETACCVLARELDKVVVMPIIDEDDAFWEEVYRSPPPRF